MAIPSGVNYFVEDSSAFECPRRNGLCLVCRKRLLTPTKSSVRQKSNYEEIIPPNEILKQIASILEVSPGIYRDVGIGVVPGPVLCTSCTRTVADAYDCQQGMKTLERQLKRLTEIIKREMIRSFHLETDKEVVDQMGTDCVEIRLIRKTYAQCLGICQVKARPCDAAELSMDFDDNCLSPLSGPVDADGKDDDCSDMEDSPFDPLDMCMAEVGNISDGQVGPSTQVQGLRYTKFRGESSSSLPVSFFVPELTATLPGISHRPRACKGRRWQKPYVPIGFEGSVEEEESKFVGISTEENISQSNVGTPNVKIETCGDSETLNEISECKYDPSLTIPGNESQLANVILVDNNSPTETVNINLRPRHKIVEGSLARICEEKDTKMDGNYDDSDSGDNFEPAEGMDSDFSNSEYEERESKRIKSNVNRTNKSLGRSSTANLDSLKCPQCNFCSQNLIELWTHRKEVHGFILTRSPNCGSGFKCELCGCIYSAYKALYDHVKVKHTEFKLSCDICGLEFKNRSRLKKHKEVGHSEYKLSEEVVPEGKLQDHLERQDGSADSSDSEYEERESKRVRSNANRTNKSLDRSLTTNLDSFKCPQCNFCSQNLMDLWTHRSQVHGFVLSRSPNFGTRFKCEICGCNYSAFKALYDHVKVKHTEFKLSCDICGLEFGNRSSLQKHKKVGHGKHSRCNLCGHVVLQRKLHEHLEMHDGSADFPCKTCPMRLATSRALNLHRSRYHGEGVGIQAKVFSCKVCPMKFDKFPDFLDHRRDHLQKLKQRTFKCSLCNAYFKSETRLQVHRNYHAEGSKKFRCNFCSTTFDKIPDARNHMNTVHAKESEAVLVDCTICGEKLSGKERLQKHLDNHKSETNFPCKFCPAQFSKADGLRGHLLRKHRPNIRCGVCHKSCPSYDELRAHKKSEHGLKLSTCFREKRYKCTFCQKSFTKKCNLNCHLKHHAGKVNFPCTVCGGVFKTIRKLKHHLGLHEKGEIPKEKVFKFKCEICEKTLTQEGAIERHLKAHANPHEFVSRFIEGKADDDNNLISFDCKVCKQTFTRDSNTNNANQLEIICEHGNCGCRETFTDLKVFMFHHRKVCTMKYGLEHFKTAMESRCDECDKVFKTPRILIVHKQKVHPGSGSFMCEICGRAFGVRNFLVAHMGIHNTEFNFQCHICGNKYKSKLNLNSHIRKSHGEARYPCDVCRKEFKSRDMMRQHKHRVHSEAKPEFPCHICGKLFKMKQYVLQHVNVTHLKRGKCRDRQRPEHDNQEESHYYGHSYGQKENSSIT